MIVKLESRIGLDSDLRFVLRDVDAHVLQGAHKLRRTTSMWARIRKLLVLQQNISTHDET